MLPVPFVTLFGALLDSGADTRQAQAGLSELRQRLGATPATAAGGLLPRLEHIRKAYGQGVLDAVQARLRASGIDPTCEQAVASVGNTLTWLARTIAHPVEPVGEGGTTTAHFSPAIEVNLRNLAAWASAGHVDLLGIASFTRVLYRLDQAERMAEAVLTDGLADQRFTPATPADPVETRVLAWLHRTILAGALPPFPEIGWIADWVRGAALPPGELEGYSPAGATLASAHWHGEPVADLEVWDTWRQRVAAERHAGWRPSPGATVRAWDNGWTMQALTAEQLPEESRVMQHCVGYTNQNYISWVRRGSIEIWSLRNPEGYPVATLEIQKRPIGEGLRLRGLGAGDITGVPQVRGPQNRAMHPAHRMYFWDLFKDHLKLLPVALQDDLLGQFVSRSSPEFATRVLATPETALRWAKTQDRGSRPDTRAAALRDPEVAVRWAREIDRQLRLDTFLAVKDHPSVHATFLRFTQKQPLPKESEVHAIMDTMTTWNDALLGIDLFLDSRRDLAAHLLNTWVRHPQVAARVLHHHPLLSEETIHGLKAEFHTDHLSDALRALAYRDPWAAVACDYHTHSDSSTLAGATVAAQNPNAAALYLRTIDTDGPAAAVLVEGILHAPEGAPDPLTPEARQALNEDRGWKRDLKIPNVHTPGRVGAIFTALLVRAYTSAPLGEVRPLLDGVHATVSAEAEPRAWAVVFAAWPDLVSDPAFFALAKHFLVLLQLSSVYSQAFSNRPFPEPLRQALARGTALRKILLASSLVGTEFLQMMALKVDRALYPDIARSIVVHDRDAFRCIAPSLLDPTQHLDATLRRELGAQLHPNAMPGWAYGESTAETKKAWGVDVAGLWQHGWIEAQLAVAIRRLRQKHTRSPLAVQRRVEEAIQDSISSGFTVGRSAADNRGWGARQPPLPTLDGSTLDLRSLRAELCAARLPDLEGLDDPLNTARNRDTIEGPVLGAALASPNDHFLPAHLYLGLLGPVLSSGTALCAPLLGSDSISAREWEGGPNPAIYQGTLRRNDPRIRAMLEHYRNAEPKVRSAWTRANGLSIRDINLDQLKLRAIFLAATPWDAERATGAAVIVPILPERLPTIGWLPTTMPNGAAGTTFLFVDYGSRHGEITFAARNGALTRTTARPSPS